MIRLVNSWELSKASAELLRADKELNSKTTARLNG